MAVSALAMGAAACSDATSPEGPPPFLIGGWDAVRLVVTNKADPSMAPDLIRLGSSFFVDVQPSGQYTAILTVLGQPSTEFGRVSVQGNQLTFHREHPGPARSDVGTYRLSGDTLFLVGDTEFDFNFDGQPEAARLNTDLVKRR